MVFLPLPLYKIVHLLYSYIRSYGAGERQIGERVEKPLIPLIALTGRGLHISTLDDQLAHLADQLAARDCDFPVDRLAAGADFPQPVVGVGVAHRGIAAVLETMRDLAAVTTIGEPVDEIVVYEVAAVEVDPGFGGSVSLSPPLA